MKTKTLIPSILALAIGAGQAQAYVRPWAYELLPVDSYGYSVAFAISPDGTMAVGVSSNVALLVDANKQLSWTGEATLVPTVWDLSSIPSAEPYQVAGQALSGFTQNAALYGVSNATGGVRSFGGTLFESTSSTTRGFVYKNGTTYPFTASGTNSYGYGVTTFDGGLAGPGWAMDGTVQRPVYYVGIAPTGTTTGLNYMSASGVSGSGYKVSMSGIFLGPGECGVAGSADGNAVYWRVHYDYNKGTHTYSKANPFITQKPIPSSSSTSGAAYGIIYSFTLQNVMNNNWITGTDYSPNPDSSFTYDASVGADTVIESIPGIGYAVCNAGTSFVGTLATSPVEAFISTQYATYGSAYDWLSGYNWGPIVYPETTHPYQALNIGAWSSMEALYDVVFPVNPGFHWTVGYGTPTGGGQKALLVIYEPE